MSSDSTNGGGDAQDELFQALEAAMNAFMDDSRESGLPADLFRHALTEACATIYMQSRGSIADILDNVVLPGLERRGMGTEVRWNRNGMRASLSDWMQAISAVEADRRRSP